MSGSGDQRGHRMRVLGLCGSIVIAISWLLPGTTSATPQTYEFTVDAKSNIYGAGHAVPPEPGGGGAGMLPPGIVLPSGSYRTVVFTSVTGLVNCCGGTPDTGPDGTGGATDILSYGGISATVDGSSVMFLAGVFLSDAEPCDPAPSPLAFSSGAIGEEFTDLWPGLHQTFFIGDGLADSIPQVFHVPIEATRLFLGIADAQGFWNPPGWYADNTGAFFAEFEVEEDAAAGVVTPETATTWGTLKALYR